MRVKKTLGLILGIAVAGMVSGPVYAEDASITMSVSPVSVNVVPSDLSGTVATSDTGETPNIQIKTSNSTGYTLSIQSDSATAPALTGTNGSISSITSAISSASNFTSGTYGYRPTKKNGVSWNNLTIGSNTVGYFLPAPTSNGDILDVTDAANTTDNEYKLEVATKVGIETVVGKYSRTFTIVAVANEPGEVTLTFDANGGTFAGGGATNILTYSVGTQNLISGTYIDKPNDRTGYIFLGWATTPNATTPNYTYDPNAIVMENTTIYAVWLQGKSLNEAFADAGKSKQSGYYKMQDMSVSICNEVPTPTTAAENISTQLIDTRDNEVYTVKKLADGNCWMTENLRLGGDSVINLTPSDTNIISNWTLPASGTANFDNSTGYTTAAVNANDKNKVQAASGSSPAGKIGNYYNYCAASAGTYCYASGSAPEGTNAEHDICPKGWRMPTGGSSSEYNALYTAYSSDVASFQAALVTPLSGYFDGGSALNQGSVGYFWSSTFYNGSGMYYLGINSSYVNPTSVSLRYYGHSVRCIAGSIKYMQDVEEWKDELTAGDSVQAVDMRDGEIYTVGRLDDGNIWMLDNLALDLTDSTVKTKLTSSTTNASDTSLGYLKNGGGATSNKYATAGVANWTSSHSYSAPLINMSSKDIVPSGALSTAGGWKIGGYYNYCAASAGSYCYGNGTSYGTSSGDAIEDICPKGWRMPGGGDTPPTDEYQNLYNQYNNYTNFRNALHLPLSGHFDDGLVYYRGSGGYVWSSTRYNDYAMHYLYADTGDISPTNRYSRYRGYSVRCIADLTNPFDRAFANAEKTKQNGYYKMQDMSASICNEVPTPTTVTEDISTQLIDTRDNEVYTVKKLADGNCWMTENLRLGGDSPINLTPADTNITSNWTLPVSGTTRFTNSTTGYTEAGINADSKTVVQPASGSFPAGKIGNYYNYCAASAGTYCYAFGSAPEGTNAEHDICPKGWRMPTGGSDGEYNALYTAYSSDAANFQAALVTPLSGYFGNGSANGQGGYNYFWSSTRADGNFMYRLYVDFSVVSPTSSGVRDFGYSVRCVADLTNPFDKAFANAEKTKQNGYYKMQDMSASICSAVLTPTATTEDISTQLIDTRDSKVYWVSKLKDGNCWMTQNLDLDLSSKTTLTSSDTNITSDWTPPATAETIVKTALKSSNWATSSNYTGAYSFDGGDAYLPDGLLSSECSEKDITTCSGAGTLDLTDSTAVKDNVNAHYHVGNLYTWNAATANTHSSTKDYSNASGSICPKGWRLPTAFGGSSSINGEFKNLVVAYGNNTSDDSTLRAEPLFFARSGYTYTGTVRNVASRGYYWSSTVKSSSNAYPLYFNSTSVTPTGNNGRGNGFAVRCVAQSQ